MSIVTDAIAAHTADLAQEVATPTGDLGFGSDMSCADDITGDAAEVAGDSPLAVAQANYRRITTPRGSLPDDEDYGIDVREYLNHGVVQQSIPEIIGRIRSELRKDDRNEMGALDIRLAVAVDLKSFTLDIRGETAEGPFDLTLAVTDGGVLLKEINGSGGTA